MTCDPSSSRICTQLTFNSGNNNQLSKIGSTTVSYDSDGDLLSDTVNSYTWDAEQRLSTVSGRWTALYNALGQRVQKQFSDTSDNLYDPSGQQIGTHDVPANDWDDQDVKFGGRNLVYFSQSGAGTRFFHVNTLGSVGYATGPAGVHVEAMVYYPFGSTWQDTTGAIWDERFASLPAHDADIQLYSTPNRQYSPGLGRWMTPDPAGQKVANPANPDSFNRYAYALNNPTNLTDPSGLDPSDCTYQLDQDGNPISSCAGADTITVSATPPSEPVVVQTCDSFGFDCTLVTVPAGPGSGDGLLGFHPGGEGGGGGGGGGKPSQPKINPDIPINSFAAQAFAKVYADLNFLDPEPCGGGVFGFRGEDFDLGIGKFGSYVLASRDSQSGTSVGTLVEAGAGPVTGGKETEVNPSSGQSSSSDLLFVGEGVGAFGGFNSNAMQLGAYGSLGVAGGGAYVSLVPYGSCH